MTGNIQAVEDKVIEKVECFKRNFIFLILNDVAFQGISTISNKTDCTYHTLYIH